MSNLPSSEHTPGPWHYAPHGSGYSSRELFNSLLELPIRVIMGEVDVAFIAQALLPEEEQDANARLIAAAPDLLVAVETAIAYMEKLSSAPDNYHAEMMEPLRAAIAKAKGDSHAEPSLLRL